jgi:hypothetical protein
MRVVPRPRSKEDLAQAPGKLLATMLSVATAGLLDAVRFRRGREYARSGAVTVLDIEPGSLRGSVQGSRPEPYEVEVRTTTVAAPAGSSPTALAVVAPNAAELWTFCSCPDGDGGACKHVVAALLCFADEVALRPDLLMAWRAPAEGAPSPRAVVGSRRPLADLEPSPEPTRAGTVSTLRPGTKPAPTAPPPSPFATDEWRQFTSAPPGAPDVDQVTVAVREAPPLNLGREPLGGVDLSAMIRSALQAMRAAAGDLL